MGAEVPAVKSGAVVASLRATALARVRRPSGLVEHTRWLFLLCVLLSLAVTLPSTLAAPNATILLLLVGAVAALCACWVSRYLTRATVLLRDLGEAVAVLMFAAACANPVMVFGFVFPAAWFRALYGSTTRFVTYCAAIAGAVAAAVPLWDLLPGHDPTVSHTFILGALPGVVVTATAARHLALGMFAREQSQHRDAALARLGRQLLLPGAARAEIYRREGEAAAAICAATPGLRALVAVAGGDELRVVVIAGDFVHPPATLPRALFADTVEDGSGLRRLADVALVAAAAGIVGEWLCISLPDRPDGWMVLGAPSTIPAEAIEAMKSMMNQIALATRNSDTHQDLATQAHTDGLTGLANHAAFTAALEASLAGPGPGPAVLFLDLDDFKTVNDSLGHPAGDELLRHVATRLRKAVRPDDLCARLGGDEFAVLLNAADDGVAEAIAQRVVELVATPVKLLAGSAEVGASVGLARATSGTSVEQVVQRADIAMYAAKARGKNGVQVFHASLLHAEV